MLAECRHCGTRQAVSVGNGLRIRLREAYRPAPPGMVAVDRVTEMVCRTCDCITELSVEPTEVPT